MGVNSHQMSIVWCLTRKGMKNLEDQIDDVMGDRILTKWANELMMKWVMESVIESVMESMIESMIE